MAMCQDIKIISTDDMLRMINATPVIGGAYCEQSEAGQAEGVPLGLFLAEQADKSWVACDNSHGYMYLNEFFLKENAIKWLRGKYKKHKLQVSILERSNKKIITNREFISSLNNKELSQFLNKVFHNTGMDNENKIYEWLNAPSDYRNRAEMIERIANNVAV